VADPSECGAYHEYTPGACNGSGGGGSGGCSASGVYPSAGGMVGVAVFVPFLALAALRAIRRRFA
jgi:hypothetical protein